jgi:type I restriction enzyme M protein
MMENLSGNLIMRSATLLQHVLNSMKPNGKAAIVLPTGFLTAKSSVEGKLLKHIVNRRVKFL